MEKTEDIELLHIREFIHDFNNLMTVILGNVQQILFYIDKDCGYYKNIKAIENATKRAVNITREVKNNVCSDSMHTNTLYQAGYIM